MNDHLTNAHNLEKKMGHVKKAAMSVHQAQLQKEEVQTTQSNSLSHPDLSGFYRGGKIVIQGPHAQRLDSVET